MIIMRCLGSITAARTWCVQPCALVGISLLPPHGAYYAFGNVPGSARPMNIMHRTEACVPSLSLPPCSPLLVPHRNVSSLLLARKILSLCHGQHVRCLPH